jgi:hypothetical protein
VPRDGIVIAPLASPDVVAEAFRAEVRQATEGREIHLATCRPRRQGLACHHCWQVAERLDRAEARLKRAEREARP